MLASSDACAAAAAAAWAAAPVAPAYTSPVGAMRASQALVGGRVDFVHDLAVQVVREQDQAEGDQRQEGEHHREALEEFKVVITHDPPASGGPAEATKPRIIPEQAGAARGCRCVVANGMPGHRSPVQLAGRR
jgi:hypothetical protein